MDEFPRHCLKEIGQIQKDNYCVTPLTWSPLLFSCSVMSDSSQPHGLQHARPPCPSLPPRVCSNSWPLNQWCHPIISFSVACLHLLLPLIFPSIRVFSNESALCIKTGASASSNSSSNKYSGLICFRIDWFDLLAVLEIPSAVKFLETESRAESGCLGLGEGGSWCLMGTGFQFCRRKELDG